MMKEAALTGKELLKKVSELSPIASKKEIARASGYVARTKAGKERVNLTKFMNALLAAKGISMGGQPTATRGGRNAGYRIRVQANGNLLVGAAYTREMDLEPGTEFEIVLGRKFIKLVKVGQSDEPEEKLEEPAVK
ncbi:AbrB family transcriptional regulator [Anthocerotibacter panamensis]|uniref:AbrB family transcriptional regulator n=1 Tax=Anthocerotibacter panamensis TaxID=2857077 RepID=UPI001FDA667C|nr:AbrB family transcriptional regulator [Anthocerotibacter panamensis]